MSTRSSSNTITVFANVELYAFPKEFTFDDYLILKKYGELGDYLVDQGHNLAVDAGMNQIIALMIGTNTNSFTHCRVGSGTNAAAAGDTDLQTIIGSGLTITNRYSTSLNAKFDTFFSTSDNNGTWAETGLATASTGGTLLCRRLFSSSFVKSTSNTAIVAWTITLAAV